MNYQEILQKYISDCASNLLETGKILNYLKTQGIRESYLFDSFRIGYSSGDLGALVSGNKELEAKLEHLGLMQKGKETLANHIIIPIMDSQKEIVNIVGYNPHPRRVKRITALNQKGLFNKGYLNNCETMIITDNPLHSLLLIQSGYNHSTFLYYNDKDIVEHFKNHKTREALFAFSEAKELFYQLTTQGYAVKRLEIDFDRLKKGPAKAYLEKIFEENTSDDYCEDKVKKIENGFLFHLTNLSYRVIGNFSEFTLHMRANIKAFTEKDVFVDMVDLYKNRDRNNFIFNLMDKFEIRDQ
ncbi:MAG: hypothetical protein JXR70_17960, partial [Spirochaetales bacterium]|nr:hypothetical protein [Spirochaetales bacterium]